MTFCRVVYILNFCLSIFTVFSRCESSVSPVSAIRASLICNRMPGLSPSQRLKCQTHPDAIVAVGDGVTMGYNECMYQFRDNRWNCTAATKETSLFGYGLILASGESAFEFAMVSAGVAYYITQACSAGNISDCSCDRSNNEEYAREGWKWGGCSADIDYGVRFSRSFVDARETEEPARALMNVHNNEVGRRLIQSNMQVECKCHGVSGSCTTRTCWTALPEFRTIGDLLYAKYEKAKRVETVRDERTGLPAFLKLRNNHKFKKPKRSQLVYLEKSPNFCEHDTATGSMGTVTRSCNRTSSGMGGCELLCCGRGYNTHQYTRVWQCNCKFHWCCYVTCKECSERTEIYTCK